jgi:hypothetical protein
MRRVTGECSENPSIQDACFAGPCRANCLALYWRGGGGGTDECTQLVPCDWEAHDANKSRKRSARSAVSLRPEPAVGQGLARISRTLGEWYGMGPWILALFAASQRARRRAKHGCPHCTRAVRRVQTTAGSFHPPQPVATCGAGAQGMAIQFRSLGRAGPGTDEARSDGAMCRFIVSPAVVCPEREEHRRCTVRRCANHERGGCKTAQRSLSVCCGRLRDALMQAGPRVPGMRHPERGHSDR